MSELSASEAVERARRELGIAPQLAARAWRVRRLDRAGADYYLILFGGDDATEAVAAVEARGGSVASSARLPGRGPHLVVGRERALELAGLGASARAEMIWEPCRATYSPLYPLWEVSGAAGKVFVDQSGAVWRVLERGGPGG